MRCANFTYVSSLYVCLFYHQHSILFKCWILLKFNILNMQQYGDIRTLYTACKHRGFVMISYYDIRASRNAMKSLQNRPLRRRKLDIHYSIPKVNFCVFIFWIEDISSYCVLLICILVMLIPSYVVLKTIFLFSLWVFFSGQPL